MFLKKHFIEKQSICLANALFKIFGKDHLIEEIVSDFEKIKNEKSAITYAHRISFMEKFVAFRWEWKGSGSSPNLKFKKGTKEHQELTECNNIMPVFNKFYLIIF